jgi:hypothetical protein
LLLVGDGVLKRRFRLIIRYHVGLASRRSQRMLLWYYSHFQQIITAVFGSPEEECVLRTVSHYMHYEEFNLMRYNAM